MYCRTVVSFEAAADAHGRDVHIADTKDYRQPVDLPDQALTLAKAFRGRVGEMQTVPDICRVSWTS